MPPLTHFHILNNVFLSRFFSQVLENSLLSVRGIVSFTVDMGKSRAIVRARNGVSVHKLVQAVASTSILEAAQVVRFISVHCRFYSCSGVSI